MNNAIASVRERLHPADPDGFTLAAYSHLADTSIDEKERVARAIECLSEKYRTSEGRKESTSPKSRSEKEEQNVLLRGFQPKSVSDICEHHSVVCAITSANIYSHRCGAGAVHRHGGETR